MYGIVLCRVILGTHNFPCLTIGIAAGCTDIAEVEAGFDPFDAADCVGGTGGQPATNCLFPTENLACNADRTAESEEHECAAERETRQRRNSSTRSGCDGVDQRPPDACVYAVRDPGCVGFAPGESGWLLPALTVIG